MLYFRRRVRYDRFMTVYDPYVTLSDLKARIDELLSVPTMQIWDSQEALNASSQATLVELFETRVEEDADGDLTDHLLYALSRAQLEHWSDVYYRADPVLDMARAIRNWIGHPGAGQ